MIPGVDVSRYQGRINWSRVKSAGNKYAYVKATEGVGYQDKTFQRNWVTARDLGLYVGAYHFARVSKSPDIAADARDEADYFTSVMGDVATGYLPPVLDIEWDKRARSIKPREVVQWCTVFLSRLATNTKRLPIVYTGYNYWRWKLMRTKALRRYPLWLVQYGKGKRPKKPIPGWKHLFWQWSHTQKVSGIPSNTVDQNLFDGTIDELRALSRPAHADHVPSEIVVPTANPLFSASMARIIESYVGIAWRSESFSNDKGSHVEA